MCFSGCIILYMIIRDLDKNTTCSLSGENTISMSLFSHSISVYATTSLVVVVELNNYCRLIYEPCLHKCTHFFVLTATLQNLSASLKISLFYQIVYQYLLDNLVSGPSFVSTVIATLHPSNRLWAPVCPDLLWCSQAASVNGKDLTGLPTCWRLG